GWSPHTIAIANWAIGAGLAGFAAILVTPIVTLQVSVLTNVVLAALAAALMASFRSFPVAFAAAVVIGVTETLLTRYVDQPGLARSLAFLVIVVVMVARGQSLPLRDFFLQRLPSIGSGRVRPGWLAVAVAVALITVLTTSANWVAAITLSIGMAL